MMKVPFLNFVVLVIGFAPPNAMSCSVHPASSDAELFENADVVFIGRVMETRLKSLPAKECDSVICEIVEGDYSLVESLKGKPPKSGKVLDNPAAAGACSAGLIAGWYYVFYMGPDKVVAWPRGTYPIGFLLNERDLELAREIRLPPHKRPLAEG